jgi:plastocyanin
MKAIKNLLPLGLLGVGAILTLPSIPAGGAVINVAVGNDFFSPSTSSIHTGDEVIWTWQNGADEHNVVSTSASFAWLFPNPSGGPGTTSDQNDGNTRNSPFSFTNTFNSAGSFPYECTVHASIGMLGTITVTAPAVSPVVNITNPASGAVFSAPANLNIQASATISSGTVTNVQFLIGSTVLANKTAAPFSTVTNNLAAGTYKLSAIASGSDGLTATNSVTISVVTPAPLTATAPAISSSGSFQFSYSATVGLTYVVQVSTNLLSGWTSLATNTPTTSLVLFTAPASSANGSFYRVEQLPNP